MHFPRARHMLPKLLVVIISVADPAAACIAPERPFLPRSQSEMRAYADLIRKDFETYIAEVQHYFRCLEEERSRVFIEAQEISQDYGRFVRIVE